MSCSTATVGLTFLSTRELGPRRQAHRFETSSRAIGSANCQFRERPRMCGICGYVAFPKLTSSEVAHVRVKAMLGSLAHRGPDATSQLDTESAVFGVTRLAIRGLTERLSQPIVDPESGVIAVCNGEIDNHHELSRWLAERGRPVQHKTDIAVIPGLYLEHGEAFAKSARRSLCHCGVGSTLQSPYTGTRPRRRTPAVLYSEPKGNHFCD